MSQVTDHITLLGAVGIYQYVGTNPIFHESPGIRKAYFVYNLSYSVSSFQWNNMSSINSPFYQNVLKFEKQTHRVCFCLCVYIYVMNVLIVLIEIHNWNF